jgi:predicted DCC family thiol-disulfide oxidoreductase YuxK
LKEPISRIVFYDGHCGLCNRVVRWLLRIDRQGKLRYAPLEGAAAKRLLPRLPQDLDAIVYWREGKPLVDTSNAIGTILREMDWPWRALSAILWVPRPLRDLAYRWVASRRYRFFGRHESCPLPSPEARQYFLD